MDHIKMNKIIFYGYHGLLTEEHRLGQQFIVDMDLALDLQLAGKKDEIKLTVSYAEVYETIKNVMEGPRVNLLEKLAEKIAEAVLETYTCIVALTVEVTKPHPPFAILCDGVTVQIHRNRENLRQKE